jgi:DNA-directed RNA polymerase specialized sigma24 family protein
MDNEVTGSIERECERRLTNLFKQSNTWLLKVAYNVCKSYETSEDLVQELYEYLHNKKNPNLFFKDDSYNLIYCMKFIKHRFINKTKKLNRIKYIGEIQCDNSAADEYDIDYDLAIEEAYKNVRQELEHIKKTKDFASAMLYEHYWFTDDTLDEVANKIKISKSTTFLQIKKVRNRLKQVIDNPFK